MRISLQGESTTATNDSPLSTKICSKCRKNQPINNFTKDKHKHDGLRCWCKNCVKNYDSSPKVKQCKKNYWESIHGKNMKIKFHKTPAGIYMVLKSSAKKRGISFDLNQIAFSKWYNKQQKVCHYCNKTEKNSLNDMNRKMYRLSIDRKNTNRGYILGNIILSCYKCNMIKSNDISYETMLKIGRIIKNEYNKN